MAKAKQLSRSAYDRLSEELHDLSTRGRIDIAKKIEAARELGDLSENGDYHAAKEEQGKMEGRIMHLEYMLEDVEIIEGDAPTDTVSNGNVVEIRYQGETQTELCLVGSIEERRPNVSIVSPGSPFGAALMGKKAGETVTYEAPGGMISVEIISIQV